MSKSKYGVLKIKLPRSRAMNWDADVIIVGAGPGGASAAYFLGEAGYRVLVLEKCGLPRYKTCAGGVPTSAMHYFPFDFAPVIEQHIDRASFVYQEKQITQSVPDNSVVMVMRDSFDDFILGRSKAEVMQGVEVQAIIAGNCGYEVKTMDGRSFSSRYVLGADGANSRVANTMGMRRNSKMGVALEVEAQVSPQVLESFQGRFLIGLGELQKGYYWIFPKSGHLSIGLGTMHKGGDKQLFSLFSRVMYKYGIETERFSHNAHPLPVYNSPNGSLQKGGVLLLGDAAGLVDPLTGEGIRHAIESGYLAAHSIANNQIDLYTEMVDRQIVKDLYYAKRVSDFFYRHQKLSFECLVRNKIVFQDLINITTHQLQYKKGIQKFPYYLLNFWQRIGADY